MFVEGQVMGAIYPRVDGGSTISRVAWHAISGECMQNPPLVDTKDTVAVLIINAQVPIGSPHHTEWPTCIRILGWNPCAIACSCYSGDGST